MARSDGSPPGLSFLVPLATIILVITTLHYARDVLVPICLAILITFVLSPVVGWLEKLHLKRVPSTLIVIVLFVTGIGALTWIVARQLLNVAVQLPEYRANIEKKLESDGGGPQGKLRLVLDSFQDIQSDLSIPAGQRQSSTNNSSASNQSKNKPAPVVVESRPSPLFSTLLGPMLAPFATFGAVIVFSLFMLADREFLRNKILRLAGRGHLTATTRALDEAAQRVSRYLLLQSTVNIGYGSIVAIGLHLLGVPNALVWGVLSGLLRYIPYLGAIIATALPSLVALGAFADWHRALYVLAFYVVLEITTANFFEPYIYGSQTGVSAFAILVAAVFWSLIWGPVGLLLSTPLTVCLVAFGRNVSSLEFLTVLLGDEPALAPNLKVYQRLLADDADEALTIAKGYLQKNSLESLYDSVLVPVLAMIVQDRRRGALNQNQEALVLDNFRDLVEELNQNVDGNGGKGRVALRHGAFVGNQTHCLALAVPARNEADEIAAVLLTGLINQSEVRIDVLAASPLKESLEQISDASPALVCISSIPPLSVRYTRTLYKSIKHLHPNTLVIVGVWSFEGPTMSLQERIGIAEPDKIATKLLDALQEIQASARQPC